jgi:Tol biopolymer transport system component
MAESLQYFDCMKLKTMLYYFLLCLLFPILGCKDKNESQDPVYQPLRLTTSAGIDFHPSFSPDGQSIIFDSDRSGQYQLYIIHKDGSNEHAITTQGGDHPRWSPDGTVILYESDQFGSTDLLTILPDGTASIA